MTNPLTKDEINAIASARGAAQEGAVLQAIKAARTPIAKAAPATAAKPKPAALAPVVKPAAIVQKPAPTDANADGQDIIALARQIGLHGIRTQAETPAQEQGAAAFSRRAGLLDEPATAEQKPVATDANADGADVIALARQLGLQGVKPQSPSDA